MAINPFSRLLAMIVLAVALPASAFAGDERWGVSIWGLSYHTNRSADYNEDNWGLGARYYFKPDRLFMEVDALRNSNRGLVLPVSLGVEFRIAPLPAGCKLSGVGALTVAYYQFADTNNSVIKYGPVPGVTVGCGRFKANLIAVLRKSSEPLAALTASLTIMF